MARREWNAARNGLRGAVRSPPRTTREPARSGKKKPQPRTVGVSLLVEAAGIEPEGIFEKSATCDALLLNLRHFAD